MENLKARLNKINSEKFVKLSELEQGKPYKINFFEKIMINSFDNKNKRVEKICVVLENESKVIIPDRYFKDHFTDKDIKMYNASSENKFNLIYNGVKNFDNGKKTMHMLEFN